MARRIQVTIIGDSASLERSFARSSKAGRTFGADMESAGRSVAGMAKKFAEAGVVIGAAVGYTIKKAVDFNQQMLLIQTQAGASAAEVANLSASVLAFSKISPQGPVQLAQGLYHLESLGLRSSKAMDTLKIASFAAGMGLANLEETSTALGSVVVTGIKGAQNYSQAMAAIVATVGAGNVRMQDLAGALGNITPAAASSGITLKEMGAALATLTDRGFSADEATTRLRFALTQIQRPTPAAAKALADMGVNADNLGKVIRQPNGLLKVLTILKEGIASVGVVRGNRDLLSAFGGARSGLGIQTLVQSLNQGLSSYQQKLIQVTEGEKKYAENQKAYLESPGYKLHAMWSMIQADLVETGDDFLPFGVKVVDGFSAAVTGISNFIDKFSHAMNIHYKIKVLWSTAENLKDKAESTLKAAISKIDWNKVWSGAKGVDAGLQKRMENVDWSSVGTNIGKGFTAAVYVALTATKKLAGAFMDIFEKVNWEKLGESLGPGLATAIVVAFATLTDPMFWIHHWQLALAVFSVVFGDGLGKIAGKLAAPFLKLGGRLMGDFALSLAEGAGRLSGKLADSLSGVLGKTADLIESYGGKLGGPIVKFLDKLSVDVLRIGGTLGDKMLSGLIALPKLAAKILGKITKPLQDAVGTFFKKIGKLATFTIKVLGMTAVISAIGEFAKSVLKAMGHLADMIGSSLDGAFKAMKIEAIQAAINIADPFSSLPGKFGQWARDLKDKWNAEIAGMKMPPAPTLTGPTGTKETGPPGVTGPTKPGKFKTQVVDPITKAISQAKKAVRDQIGQDVGQNDRGGDRGSQYNSDGTLDPTQKAPPVPKVKGPKPDPTLTKKKKVPGPTLKDIFPAEQQEALSKAVAANATASSNQDLTVQYAGMSKLVLAYKTALGYLKSEKETGAKRLLQVKEETSLTKSMAAVRKSMQALMAQEITTARSQIGGLFSGPVLQPTEASTGAMLGAPNADPKVLLQDLQGQNAQFATWVSDISKLSKRGAPKELIKELQEGGVSNLEQVQALSGASKSVLDKYFSAFKQRENLAMKVAKVDMQAGIVHISGKVATKGNHPAGDFSLSTPSNKPTKSIPHHAVGGVVADFGAGSTSGDTVPAMLTPKEIVFNARQQARLATLLNLTGASPHALFNYVNEGTVYAKGGVVAPAGMTGPAGWGAGGSYPVVYSGGKWRFNAGPQFGQPIKQQDLGTKAWVHDHGFNHPGTGDTVNLSHGYLPMHQSTMDKLGSGLGQAIKGMPHALKQTAKGLNDDVASLSYRVDKKLGTPMVPGGIEARAHARDPHLFHNATVMFHQTVKSFKEAGRHPLRDPANTVLSIASLFPGGSMAKLSDVDKLTEAGSILDKAKLGRYGGDIRDSRTLSAGSRTLDKRLKRDIGPRVLAIPHRVDWAAMAKAAKSERGSITPYSWIDREWDDIKSEHGISHPSQMTLDMAQDYYQTLNSGDINGHLRSGNEHLLAPHVKKVKELLDGAMTRTKEGMTLFRGMPLPPKLVTKDGFASFVDPGFHNASSDPEIASTFAVDTFGTHPTIHEIKIPSGASLLKMKESRDWGDQAEYLLPRNSKFNVSHVGKKWGMDHIISRLKDERGSINLGALTDHGFHSMPRQDVELFSHSKLGVSRVPVGGFTNFADPDINMYVHGIKTKMPHLKAPTSAEMGKAPWKQYFAMLLDDEKGHVYVGSPGALHGDLYGKIESMFKDPKARSAMQNRMTYFEQGRGMFSDSGHSIDQVNMARLWGEKAVPHLKPMTDLMTNASERAYKLGFGALQLRKEAALLKRIPKLSKGGITTGPTLALIGERGREAVIPLPNGGMHTGPREVVVQIDGREVGRAILPYQQRTKNATPVQRRGRHGGSGLGLS